jgi:hypothetical protein
MTLAQQNGITQFPYIIKNTHGRQTYYETSSGYWHKLEYDAKGNRSYFEDSIGYWTKKEYDEKGNRIYYEDSDGNIIDKRPKKPVNHLKVQLTI